MFRKKLLVLFFIISSSVQAFRLIGITSEISLVPLAVSQLCGRINIYQIFLSLFIAILATSSLYLNIFLGNEYSLSSFFIALITMVLISSTNLHLLYDSRKFIIKYAVFSVYISIVLAIIETYMFQVFEARTNLVLFLNRLTFFFDEPSHYAIFIALVLHITDFKKDNKFDVGIIAVGLVLTWSLSGFLLFSLIYFYRYTLKFDKKTLKVFFTCGGGAHFSYFYME